MSQNVALDTTLGTITLELYTLHAPRTCQNFATLASRGYYDGTIFHRIVPNFVAQGGDPTGTGRGGESIYPGGQFEDEIHEGLRHAGAGVLSMANAGKDTNGSQFFLTLSPTPWLDGRHTIFGRVKAGMPVLKRIGSVPTDREDRPLQEVRIIQARVFQGDDGSSAPVQQRAVQDKRRTTTAAPFGTPAASLPTTELTVPTTTLDEEGEATDELSSMDTDSFPAQGAR